MNNQSITSVDLFLREWEDGSPFQRKYTLEEAIRLIIDFNYSSEPGELEQIKFRLEWIEATLIKILSKEINNISDLNGLALVPGCFNQFVKLEQ